MDQDKDIEKLYQLKNDNGFAINLLGIIAVINVVVLAGLHFVISDIVWTDSNLPSEQIPAYAGVLQSWRWQTSRFGIVYFLVVLGVLLRWGYVILDVILFGDTTRNVVFVSDFGYNFLITPFEGVQFIVFTLMFFGCIYSPLCRGRAPVWDGKASIEFLIIYISNIYFILATVARTAIIAFIKRNLIPRQKRKI